MAVIARLLVYEGTDEALALQLGRSLNDGRRIAGGVEISVLTLPPSLLFTVGRIVGQLKELPVTTVMADVAERVFDCRDCKGDGWITPEPDRGPTPCHTCGGAGKVTR